MSSTVRRDSADGRILWEGTLERGNSLRFHGRLWLRLGAPSYLVAHLNGDRAALPRRTSTARVTNGGIRVLQVAEPTILAAAEVEAPAPVSQTVSSGSATQVSSPPSSRGSRAPDTSPGPDPAPRGGSGPSPDPPPGDLSMVKTWTSVGLLAVVALLPLGAAEGVEDPTPPIVIAHVSETLGQNGWHIRDTTVGWEYRDPESGIIDSDGCDVKTVREETTGRSFTCRATNGDGLTVSVTYTVKLDETPPAVRPRPTRPADRNGWFNHRVEFQVTATDSFSGVQSCSTIPAYTDPDEANVKIRASCRDRAGHRGTGTFLLDYDDSAPKVRAILGRSPDRYGWYSHDVRVSFTGKDAVSRVDDCSSRVYRGPDTPRASVTGWCRDRAGNQRSRTRTFKFSKPLLQPRSGSRATSAPLLDWVDVRRVLEYNAQVWHDGRKILSRWPDNSRLQLDRGWRFQGEWHKLKPGERYKVYVWPRFRRGYGRLLSRGGFTFVGGSSPGQEVVAAAGLEPATHGL